jgi:hypothetical protein
MAHQMLATRLSLGGTDMVSDLHSLTATHTAAELDDTVFADTFKNRIAGLQDYTMQIGLHDDIADNLVDEILFAFWASNSIAVLWGIAQSFTETANNPEYGLTMMMLSDQAGGSVGEEARRQISLAIASGSVTRDVT